MSCDGCTHETDADVVAALPSDLGVVYERVKKQIKLPSTNTGTEGAKHKTKASKVEAFLLLLPVTLCRR